MKMLPKTMARVFVALVSLRSCFACNFSTLFAFQDVARFRSRAEKLKTIFNGESTLLVHCLY